MKRGQLPLDWMAIMNAGLTASFVQSVGFPVTDRFREGLDADMMAPGALAMVAMAVIGILLALPFVVGAVLLSNRMQRPRRAFPFFAAGLPTLLLLAVQMFFIAQAALAHSNVAPFPANSLTYLPNWLALAFVAGGFFLGAKIYLRTVDARTAGGA